MSTMIKKFTPISAVFACVVILTISCFAQDYDVKIRLAAPTDSSVRVEAKIPQNIKRKKLSFLQNYVDALNLPARIENLKFKDKENREIAYIKSPDGNYLTEDFFASVEYDARLAIPKNVLMTAHISWLAENHGILMPNDLLPDFGEKIPAKISFELPENWTISTSEKQAGEKSFQIVDLQKSVFLIGKNWRRHVFSVGGTIVNLATVGDFGFEMTEAGEISGEILSEYRNIFGEIPEKQVNIFVVRFPREIGFERWQAETRGANITIMSSPTAFENLAVQRLHEQLRHELFHLWIPNNLNLTGDYSWFYEGFTQYAALRTAVKLNRITFYNFLNTIEQAVNMSDRRNSPVSLLDASKNRWLGAKSGVYSDGMLIAFLADATLLRETRGKTDLFEIFRKLYQKYHLNNNPVDGNRAVLELLREYDALVPIIEKYITNSDKINFDGDLASTGIEVVASGNLRKVQIKTKLQSREKDFLKKLGYNNWRKALNNPK